jgi:hypothetical protein
MSRVIQYIGSNIVIEQKAAPLGFRFFGGLFAIIFFSLGLVSLFNMGYNLIEPQQIPFGNILLGIGITILCLGLPIPFIFMAIDSGKICRFDPNSRNVTLTKKRPFGTVVKHFAFSELPALKTYRDSDSSNDCDLRIKIKFPDRNSIHFHDCQTDGKNQNEATQLWLDRIREMIKPL